MTETVAKTIAWADRQLREAIERGDKPGLVVVGGGITGAAIFAKAAAAGLQPWLVERGDFASGTSSRSSKMLHGGLTTWRTAIDFFAACNGFSIGFTARETTLATLRLRQ